MEAPQLGGGLLGDQYAAGSDVPVEKEAEQVSVLQLFHHCNQRSSKRDHPEELWQEGMRPQLGQKGRKFQEAVSF
ncbi:hypothetical protein EYF80_008788 [Liparis tanakae]|uniref:Uncharacterized protein n=1 Tax=Liparis tanakae TaxID=230148 RepID=A0A4Z2IV32_9TELE|nr:hypothetical protein EYF80_008788 [Liparis tanakae]